MNKTINRIINFLKSFEGLSFVTMLALLLMIHHTSSIYVFYTKDSTWFDWTTGIIFGLVADLGILVFVTRGLNKIATYFTCGQFVINMFFYYNIVEISGIQWIGAVLMSATLPAIIAIYSNQIKETIFNNKEQEIEERQKKDYDAMVKLVNESNEKVKDNYEEDVKKMEEELFKIKTTLNKNTQTLLNNKDITNNESLRKNYLVNEKDLLS